MYLVDTNIWLERLLDQERSAEVGRFLAQAPLDRLMISDFTLHSIGVVLDRLAQPAVLVRFVDDVVLQGGLALVAVAPEDIRYLVEVAERFRLDFDDAYQYVLAERHDAVIVSFDDDFDRTGRGRRTPAQVLAELQRP